MCRLLLIKNSGNLSINNLIREFAEMCKISPEYQGHGWGVSSFVNNVWSTYKSITPIWEDEIHMDLVGSIHLIHARSAFQNEGVCIENNMPFIHDENAFIFNGELRGVKLRSEGRIGAEKLFSFITRMSSIDNIEGIEKANRIVIKRSESIRGMNYMISNGSKVLISSYYTENENYFSLWKIKSDNGFQMISSIPFSDFEWEKLENNTIEVLG